MEREIEYTLKLIVNTFPKMDIVSLLMAARKPMSAAEVASQAHHALSEVQNSLDEMLRLKAVSLVQTKDGPCYQIPTGCPSYRVLQMLCQKYNGPGRSDINQRLHDFHISESIKAILDASDRIYANDIKVVTINGVVHLSGSVNTVRELETVGTVLYPFKVRLVFRKVKNQMAVRPSRHPDDESLARQLEQRLQTKAEDFLRQNGTQLFRKMEVNVMGRVAYVEALADSLHKRNIIGATAYGVTGLAHVVNNTIIGVTVDEGMNWQG